MTLFQYLDQEIERKSSSKSASWKRKHFNALQAVKKYCNNSDIDLLGILLPGWMDGLRKYYSNPENFSESTSRQYKDVFKTLYASAINELLLPPIKIKDLCTEPWDDRQEQDYNSTSLLNQVKILDYKNLGKEESNLRDLYFLSIATMGTDFPTLLSLKKSDLQNSSLHIGDLSYTIPQILLEKINSLKSRSDLLLSLRAFYKGEAKDSTKSLKIRMKHLFHTLNLNLFQNEDTFIDWLILAKESGVELSKIQKTVSWKIGMSIEIDAFNKGSQSKPEGEGANLVEDEETKKEITQIPSLSSGDSSASNTINEEINPSYTFIYNPFSETQKSEISLSKTLSPDEITNIAYQITERLEVLTSNWYLVRIFKNHFSGEDLVQKLKKDNIVTFKPSEYYAPIYKIKTIHNGVTKIVNSSDTAKMLFVRTSLKYAQKIDRLEEGGLTVARYIKGGKFAIIPIDELQRMRKFLENNNEEIFLLQNSDYKGRKVIVTKGPYEGWEGEIVKKSTSAIQHGRKNEFDSAESDQHKEDYDNTIFIVQFLNSLKWAIPVSGLEFRFID